MKTRQPLILTARIDEGDLRPFDQLRQRHYPPDRNFIRAHLTVFHRLPGEYRERIDGSLKLVTRGIGPFTAQVNGLRHLGAGVAFTVESPELNALRASLCEAFIHWLGPQDMQKWQPHITIQNKVSRGKAHELFRELSDGFQPRGITVAGLDLWRYLDGPWKAETSIILGLADLPDPKPTIGGWADRPS